MWTSTAGQKLLRLTAAGQGPRYVCKDLRSALGKLSTVNMSRLRYWWCVSVLVWFWRARRIVTWFPKALSTAVKATFRHGISLCLRFDSGFLYAVNVGNMWLFKHFLRIMNTEVAFSSFITPGHSITVNYFFPFQGYRLFWNKELVSLHSFASLKVRVRLVVSKHTHEFGCIYLTHWLGCKWYKPPKILLEPSTKAREEWERQMKGQRS